VGLGDYSTLVRTKPGEKEREGTFNPYHGWSTEGQREEFKTTSDGENHPADRPAGTPQRTDESGLFRALKASGREIRLLSLILRGWGSRGGGRELSPGRRPTWYSRLKEYAGNIFTTCHPAYVLEETFAIGIAGVKKKPRYGRVETSWAKAGWGATNLSHTVLTRSTINLGMLFSLWRQITGA